MIVDVDKGSQPAFPAVPGREALCINLDLANPVYISQGKNPGPSDDQIPPLGSVVLDTDVPWFVSTAAPVTCKLQVMLGARGWSPSPAQIAAQIALVGINVNIPGLITAIVPSGDISGAQDTANIKTAIKALTAGGLVSLSPGIFNINCSDPVLTNLGVGQWIECAGDHSTIINALGSGDLFAWANPASSFSDGRDEGGGLIGGATIDGSGLTGAGIAVHAGDIGGLRFDFRAQHFNQTGGSWGLLLDNRKFWTERADIKVRAKDCGFAPGDGGHVGFNVSGATTSTGSFARAKGRIEITQDSNQRDGVVLMNGAHIYDHDLEVVGNFTATGGSTTSTPLRITGVVPALHPGAGTHSAFSNGRLEIGVECSAGANPPTTIIQTSSSNSVDSYGNANWNQNFASSGLSGPGWKYDGQVQGDVALGTRRYYGTSAPQALTGNGQTIQSITPSAKIVLTATGSWSGLILAPGDDDGQVIYLICTSPLVTLTFAAAGTSNVGLGTAVQLLGGGGLLTCMWDAGTALWYVK